MKRLFALLFLFFLLVYSKAQTFQVFKGDTINRVDAKGMKQGLWRKYYKSDTLFSEGIYKNGKHTGVFHTYHTNGRLQSVLKFRGLTEISDAELYNDSAKLIARGKYIDRNKDSLWVYFDSNGKINSEEFYKKGSAEGTWKMYYPGGKVAQIEVYKGGKKNGPYKKYFESGKIKVEGIMVNGELEGKVTLYTSEGKVWQQGIYHKGDKDGKWITFNEDGSREKEEIYEKGILKNPPPENKPIPEKDKE